MSERNRAVLRATGQDGRAQLLASIPATERRVHASGISTAVLEGGEGSPVVLLHGAGEFAATWMRIIPDLVTTNRVIVPDLPGHGASEIGDGQLDTDRVTAWLGELIDETCPAPPVVVGHCSVGRSELGSPWTTANGSAGWCLSTPSDWDGSGRRRGSRSRWSGSPCDRPSARWSGCSASAWLTSTAARRAGRILGRARRLCPRLRSLAEPASRHPQPHVRLWRTDPRGGPGRDRGSHDSDLGASRPPGAPRRGQSGE